MAELKTYKFTHKSGITDLKGSLPEGGATDWWTDEDWKKWDAELPAKLAWNENYIKELKEKGEFGKEYETSFSIMPHPLFDDPNTELKMTSPVFIMNLNEDKISNL